MCAFSHIFYFWWFALKHEMSHMSNGVGCKLQPTPLLIWHISYFGENQQKNKLRPIGIIFEMEKIPIHPIYSFDIKKIDKVCRDFLWYFSSTLIFFVTFVVNLMGLKKKPNKKFKMKLWFKRAYIQ
jgi:hypothetical protein